MGTQNNSVNPKLLVFIFSYNRGDFLRNCVDSVLRHIPGALITVIDDHSNDTDTQHYLANLPSGVRLHQPEQHEHARHGGLYNNMQAALELANAAQGNTADATELALFLQDDMQVVRDVSADDWQNIHGFYQQYPNAAFLNPLFLKGARKARDVRITRLAADYPVYFRHYPAKANPRGISYADAMILHIPRLIKAQWQFIQGETENAEQAQRLFGKMGFMLHPFAMFLPEVPVFRGKQKTKAVKRAEALGGTTPNRFNSMSENEVEALKARDVARKLPVAEYYLHTERPAKIPFRYSQINVYPVLRLWHKLEQALN
ncbi:MAG: glycosyltransferase family 2 protein [Idiomarina sp.]|nr:glycosyltransferase family 2 protein [Idiomarina sp.]